MRVALLLLTVGTLAACNDATLGSSDKAPVVAIVSPLEETTFDPLAPLVLCAQVSDEDVAGTAEEPDFSRLDVLVQSSVTGTLWTSGDSTPTPCDGGNFSLTLTLGDSAQTIGLSVVDDRGQAGEAQVYVVPSVNETPWCEIDAPAEGTIVDEGDALEILARAGDAETAANALGLSLASDVDGELWTGTPDSDGDVVASGIILTAGEHTLTLEVVDPRGAVNRCGVHVQVDPCRDDDGDGWTTCDGDCDDSDETALPGGTEVADGADNDCNGTVDDGTPVYDDDGDGWTEADGDCDDAENTVNPTAPELWYDGVDQDCDGRDDDQDLDGFGVADDCDDEDASRNPGELEIWYDGIDQDCDGNDQDQDGDGYAVSDDCNDLSAAISPAAAEVWYDSVDQDCDGNDTDQDGDGEPWPTDCADTDASVNTTASEVWYDGVDQDCDGNDDDQDGDGEPYPDDCRDTDASVHTGATETWYDGVDQDCDGNDDDQDEDGWPLASDCDDTDPDVNPGEREDWYDGTDQNCDGNDDDRDGDGVASPDDCNDSNTSVYPGAVEVWYDGVDQDCDGNDDDQDEDGESYEDDCDDLDPTVYPDAAEVWYDGVDQNCDGNDADQDEDGHVLGPDCNDLDPDVNPGETEIWYDGVDDDCDGNDDDQDEDGAVFDDDCDDEDPLRSPDLLETRDGIDNDCDQMCDDGVMSPGEILITEIMKDPAVTSDTEGEWFEVYNASSVDASMCGWTLSDYDTDEVTVSGDVWVPAGGYAVFARNANAAENDNAGGDYEYGDGFQLGNSGDEVVLKVDGSLIDLVPYTSSFPSTSSYSLSLDPGAYHQDDNDIATNWCTGTALYGVNNHGTPGAANPSCP